MVKKEWAFGDTYKQGIKDAVPVTHASAMTGGDFGSNSGYAAANESFARSIVTFPKNSYNELTPQSRQKLVQKVRALDANLSIFTRITSKISQHAVGKGIFVRPATNDVEWNEDARRLFEEWASNPGVYSIDASRDHYEDQALVAETMVMDGEFFEALVKTPNGAPMVQPLDVFEVKQPYGLLDGNYIDGVRVNRYGRPTAYAVQELQKPGEYGAIPFREVMSRDMLHVYRRRRARGVRGITWFHSGINKGIDALDLEALITGTAKLHSGLAITVKGGGPKSKRGALGAIKQVGGGADATDTTALERVYGGGIISYLAENESVELHSSAHPQQNLIEFLKFLYCDIAAAVGLPLEVVYSLAPLGGVSVRGALEDAQWLFDKIQDKIIYSHSFPIYRWRIANFVKEGRLRPCKDPIWWASSWRGPAKLTVDIGRTADANIKLMKNGMLGHSRYYDERGLDAKQEIEDQIEFLAYVKAKCEEKGIPMSLLIEPTPGAVLNLQSPESEK